MKKLIFALIIFFMSVGHSFAESGYRLWMRYDQINDEALRTQYLKSLSGIRIDTISPTLKAASDELGKGLSGLLGRTLGLSSTASIEAGSVVAGTPASSSLIRGLKLQSLAGLGDEGYMLSSMVHNGKQITVIAANTDVGVLYGSFHLLRLVQTQQPVVKLSIVEKPLLKHRVLNHWDNLDRTVERGYAGFSLWNWHLLPGYLQQRYIDYARANASIGINGTVLTNVNANSLIL